MYTEKYFLLYMPNVFKLYIFPLKIPARHSTSGIKLSDVLNKFI